MWSAAGVGVDGGGRAAGTVVTGRLLLTPVGTDDVEELVVLYGDPEVARWTGPWDRAGVEAWTADMTRRWAEDGVGKWMAHDRLGHSLVGRGGLSLVVLEGEPVLEVGWVLRDARRGHGYATEIGRAALTWAAEHRPGLPVVSFTEVHNHASRAVMERLGMRHVGTIRREGLVEGRDGLQPDAPFALYRV